MVHAMRVLVMSVLVLVLVSSGDAASNRELQRFDVNAEYDCCNLATQRIVGKMTMQACAMKPGHSPLIPGNPNNARMCKPTTVTTAPTAPRYEDKPVWTTYKPNIPNGSFETWSGAKPAGFGTYSKPGNRSVEGLRDFETAFRAPQGIEGQSALLLRNFKPDVEEWVRGRPIPPQARAIMEQVVLPAGVVSCKPNCPIESGEAARGNSEAMVFPIQGTGNALCGAFTSRLRGGDKLSVSLILRAGGQPVGGATTFDILSARLSRDSGGWTKFRIPIDKLPGKERAVPDSGILQIQILPAGFSPAAAGGDVAQGSEVLVDAVHLCGGVDLQIADAKSSGGMLVSEDKEQLGAIAFRNRDNDDHDKLFDHVDTDGVEGGDDELAQLVLQLPSGARGTVALRQAGGPQVRIWTADTKKPAEAWRNLDRTLPIAEAGFTDNGAFLERVLWVEGLEPSAQTSDVKFELVVIPEGGDARSADKDLVALTVLAVKDMEWKGKENNSEDNDNDLKPDPNHPRVQAGTSGDNYDRPVRVFPDKRYEGGVASGARRDKLALDVTLNVKPPRKVALYLRSFDVDDPSAAGDEVDDEAGDGDNRGRTITAAGVFPETGTDRFSLEFEEAAATAEFQVTMQPGDNFRVAACGDKQYLDSLGNHDPALAGSWRDGARIVDAAMVFAGVAPADAELRDPEQTISDTLTVWRFVHVERDSMEPVERNVLRGSVTAITPAPGTRPDGRTAWVLRTDLNIVAARPPSDDGARGHFDSFFNGEMRIAGIRLNVVGNSANNAPDSFTVVASSLDDETFRTGLVRQGFEVEDDDRRAIDIAGAVAQAGPFTDGTPIPLPPIDRLEPGDDDNPYLKAYVYPRTDTLPEGPGSRDFLGNLRTDRDLGYIRSLFDGFGAAAYEDDPDPWTVYLLGAFQGVKWQDADGLEAAGGVGLGAVAGEADGPGGHGALIYWASGAELERMHASAPGWRLIDAVVHEMGHLFGAGHSDRGLMSDGHYGEPTAFFSPVSLRKIRSAVHP